MPNNPLPTSFAKALPWTIFVTLLFTAIYTSRSILAPLMTQLEQSLNVGHTQATSLFLIQYIGFSITLFSSGFLISKVTPAHTAAFSIVFTGSSLCLMPYVNTINEARLVFFFVGIGGGFYFPAGMAILSELVSPKDWGKAMGVHELAPTLVFIATPLLADALLQITNWQGVCAYLGTIIVSIGLCFLLFGKGGRSRIGKPSFAGCADVIRDPASWAFLGLLITSMTGEFAIFSALQLYLTSAINFSPRIANEITAYSRMFTPIAVLLGGWASDRFDAFSAIKASLIAHAAALIFMSMDSTKMVIVGLALQPSVIAFLFPIVFKVFALRFPVNRQPIILSLFMPFAGLCSGGFIPMFIGYCGERLSFKVGFLSIAAVSIATIFVLPLLKKKPDAIS